MNITISFEGPLFRVRPLWAFLAGFLASGGPFSLSQLFLLAFLVEGVMPAWWRSLEALFRGNFPPLSTAGEKSLSIPYAVPGSLAWKAMKGLGRIIAWWGEFFWPERGKVASSFFLFTLLGLSLALFQNPKLWPALSIAGALGVAGVLSIKRGREPAPWKAFYEITIPWLAGFIADHPVGFLPFLCAVGFGIMAWGLENKKALWREWLVFGPLGFLFLALWFKRHFLIAGGLACLGLGLLGDEGESRYPLVLLVFFLVAWALR